MSFTGTWKRELVESSWGYCTCRSRWSRSKEKIKNQGIFLFYTHKVDANCLQAPREKDIPAANIALNEKILALRTQWECNVTACHSEHCFIPAEGPHFALSHTHFEKWGAAIVCSPDRFMVSMSTDSIYTLSSYEATTLQRWKSRRTWIYSMQFLPMP